jgi:hypothetical protein
MIINTILALISSTSSLKFASCLQRYYDETHPNLTSYLEGLVQNNKSSLSEEDLNTILNYANSSTILTFESSSEVGVES